MDLSMQAHIDYLLYSRMHITCIHIWWVYNMHCACIWWHFNVSVAILCSNFGFYVMEIIMSMCIAWAFSASIASASICIYIHYIVVRWMSMGGFGWLVGWQPSWLLHILVHYMIHVVINTAERRQSRSSWARLLKATFDCPRQFWGSCTKLSRHLHLTQPVHDLQL